jgi:hypothetical protein
MTALNLSTSALKNIYTNQNKQSYFLRLNYGIYTIKLLD